MSFPPLGNLPELRLAAPPARVVSLVPSITGSLFDLGLGSRVVGRTDYCVYPPGQVEGVPRLGGRFHQLRSAWSQRRLALGKYQHVSQMLVEHGH